MAQVECPSRDELSAYLLGKLSGQAFEAVADHLDSCSQCQAVLPLLSDEGDSLVPQLRRPAPDDTEVPELLRLMARVKALEPAGEVAAYPLTDQRTGPPEGSLPDVSGQLDEYRLLAKIGQGGMGSVYKALHVRLERVVAVKVLLAERTRSRDAVARFQREIRAIGRLDHPHIVRATDAGEAGGVHFLVMDFVEGIDLYHLVRRLGPLAPADACELVRQAALGLQHAHEHGLIHRDVKPSNLLLGRDGLVKVLDLGLARLHGAEPSRDDLTSPGLIMGTLDYMAPEQATDTRGVDIRADIYSLGCTLYHLLAGQAPFSGPGYEHPNRKLLAHAHDPVPSIRAQRPEVPAALNDVLQRLLAKAPAERYAKPAQVAVALAPFAAGHNLAALLAAVDLTPTFRAEEAPAAATSENGSAPTVDAPAPTAARVRRSRMLLSACAALVLAGLAVGAWAWKQGTTTNAAGPPDGEQAKAETPAGPPEEERATGPAVPAARTTLAAQGYGVLKAYCYRCHGIEFKAPGLHVLDRSALVAGRKPGVPPYVAPGQPERSALWQRVGVKGDMPPAGPKPSEQEKQLLKDWIAAGAPFPEREKRPFKGEREVLTAIRGHLRQVDDGGQKFQRFFTLTHLYNNTHVADEDLRLARAALAKLVNSLSWKQAVVVPRALDAEGTVLQIDLRALGWDSPDLWKEALKAYPYGLTYGAAQDEALRALGREVAALSDCELPYLRADWFVATASRPPLYYTFLQLPETAGELERRLAVNVTGDFLKDRLARGGVFQSGVAKQNRVLDRHESLHGAYWKSYDFQTQEGAGDLVRHPLGPVFDGNPFPQQAFEHAGSEILFHLPNGLLGSLLVNARGERVDAAPVEIVSDDLKAAGTPAVVAGLSCLACHRHGPRPFEDQLRDGAAVAGEAGGKVRRLVLPREKMDPRLDRDQERFLKALDEAAGSFLKAGEDRGKGVRDFPEPVGAAARLYQKDLGLEEVAGELGLADPKQLLTEIRNNRKLQELGLGPLAKGATLKREVWESRATVTSLFQNVAHELRRGTPYVAL